MATMAGSQPRQRAFLASHSAPTSHPSPDGDGVTKTEKTKRSRGEKKTRTLHTNQKNGHLAEFMHERVRTVRRLVQGIVCQSSHSGQQAGGGAGAEAQWRTGTACQQGQATASAAYGRQVAYGGFSTQNQTETEPNRNDAKRNEMQPKRTCFSIKNVEKSTKNSFELPTVDRHTRTRTDTHTHAHAY